MKKLVILSAVFVIFFYFSSLNCAAQAPNFAWAKSAGGSGIDDVYSISVDASGNSYITGCFGSPTITFGTTTLTNNGEFNIFIAKYDALGNMLWAKSAGGSGGDIGGGISVDASGNSYITGQFNSSTIIFGTTTLTNNGFTNIFIAKYDGSGNVVWAKSFGGKYDDEGYGISVDASGSSYVTGVFECDTIMFGTTILINDTTNLSPDIFITKYDSSGNVVWAKSVKGSSNDWGNSISVDASGNSYITGWFDSPTITFDSITLINDTTPNMNDIYIAKYNPLGNIIWAKSAGGSKDDEGYSISVDASGNSYITGYFCSSTIIFGTTTLTNYGDFDIFIAKYDGAGNVVWAKSAGGSGEDWGYSVSVDAGGNSYITGYFESDTIKFGTTTLTDNGSGNIFIAKYDSSGNVLWAKSASGNSSGAASSISVDASGNSYITGVFYSPTIIFGTTTLTNYTTGDTNNIFIAKLNSVAGIDEITNNLNDISIYPNPATDKLTIEANDLRSTNYDLRIYDIVGNLVLEKTLYNKVSSIDVSALPEGVYIVEMRTENGVESRKFVKI